MFIFGNKKCLFNFVVIKSPYVLVHNAEKKIQRNIVKAFICSSDSFKSMFCLVSTWMCHLTVLVLNIFSLSFE